MPATGMPNQSTNQFNERVAQQNGYANYADYARTVPPGALDALFNPAAGYDWAAQGARQAQGQYGDLANTLWGQNMQGLGQALNATQGSRAMANAYSQGMPSQLEDWYRQYGQQFQDPTQGQSALSQYQQRYMQGPSYSQYTGNQAINQLQGPSASQQQGGAYSGAYNSQGAAERFNNTAQSTLGNSTFGGWYGANAGNLGRTTNTQNVYDTQSSQLYGPSRSEALPQMQGPQNLQQFNQRLPGLQGPARVDQAAGEISSQFRNANDASRNYELNAPNIYHQGTGENFTQQNIGLLGRQGQGEQFFGQTGGQYGQQGMGEQFAQRQLPGMEKASQFETAIADADIGGKGARLYQEKQLTDSMNQQMAARGSFNTSGALGHLGNALGAFNAADYQNRLGRIKDASSMQMSRIGQGQQMASQAQGLGLQRLGQGQQSASQAQGLGMQRLGQASDMANSSQSLGLQRMGLGAQMADSSGRSRLAQGSALQGLAGQMDSTRLSQLGQQLQAQIGASGENLAGSDLRLRQAAQADNAQLNRLMGLNTMAMSSDDMYMRGQDQAMRAAMMGSQDQLSRFGALQGSAMGAQGSELSRMAGGMNAANQMDQTQLARLMGQFGMAQGMDQTEMGRYGLLNSMSQGVDQNTLARLLGMGNMAGQAQSASGQRYNDQFDRVFRGDALQAGLYSSMYGNASQAYGNMMGNGINAGANAYGLQGQGANAGGDFLRSMLLGMLG